MARRKNPHIKKGNAKPGKKLMPVAAKPSFALAAPRPEKEGFMQRLRRNTLGSVRTGYLLGAASIGVSFLNFSGVTIVAQRREDNISHTVPKPEKPAFRSSDIETLPSNVLAEATAYRKSTSYAEIKDIIKMLKPEENDDIFSIRARDTVQDIALSEKISPDEKDKLVDTLSKVPGIASALEQKAYLRHSERGADGHILHPAVVDAKGSIKLEMEDARITDQINTVKLDEFKIRSVAYSAQEAVNATYANPDAEEKFNKRAGVLGLLGGLCLIFSEAYSRKRKKIGQPKEAQSLPEPADATPAISRGYEIVNDGKTLLMEGCEWHAGRPVIARIAAKQDTYDSLLADLWTLKEDELRERQPVLVRQIVESLRQMATIVREERVELVGPGGEDLSAPPFTRPVFDRVKRSKPAREFLVIGDARDSLDSVGIEAFVESYGQERLLRGEEKPQKALAPVNENDTRGVPEPRERELAGPIALSKPPRRG